MDVKVGSGAFMPTYQKSEELAESIVQVANGAGCQTTALLTDMNEVLASSAGNAVEVREAVQFLTGEYRNPRLFEVTMALCVEMLVSGRLADDRQQARQNYKMCWITVKRQKSLVEWLQHRKAHLILLKTTINTCQLRY